MESSLYGKTQKLADEVGKCTDIVADIRADLDKAETMIWLLGDEAGLDMAEISDKKLLEIRYHHHSLSNYWEIIHDLISHSRSLLEGVAL